VSIPYRTCQACLGAGEITYQPARPDMTVHLTDPFVTEQCVFCGGTGRIQVRSKGWWSRTISSVLDLPDE
jgi:hypothetical protein